MFAFFMFTLSDIIALVYRLLQTRYQISVCFFTIEQLWYIKNYLERLNLIFLTLSSFNFFLIFLCLFPPKNWNYRIVIFNIKILHVYIKCTSFSYGIPKPCSDRNYHWTAFGLSFGLGPSKKKRHSQQSECQCCHRKANWSSSIYKHNNKYWLWCLRGWRARDWRFHSRPPTLWLYGHSCCAHAITLVYVDII